MKMRDIVQVLFAIVLTSSVLLSIPGIDSEAVPTCAPDEWGVLCQDYPDFVAGYEPIGSILYFRIDGFSINDPRRTDIGVVVAYWWVTTEQRYYYQLLTSPADPDNPYIITEYKIIAPEDIFNE